MVKSSTILFATALICTGQQASPAPGGQISGTVKGDDGSALVRAAVFLKRTLPPGLPPRRRTEWAVMTSAGGLFHFDLLPDGEYTLCAQAPSGNWLNPCEWGATRPAVVISGAQRSVNTTIVLKRGAALSIRVDDPGQLLAQHEGKTPGAHLLLGVRSDALIFHTASVAAQDSAGRHYTLTIPLDKGVNLVVASSFFRLTDGGGTPLAGNGVATIPVTVPSGQVPPTIHLGVSGRR